MCLKSSVGLTIKLLCMLEVPFPVGSVVLCAFCVIALTCILTACSQTTGHNAAYIVLEPERSPQLLESMGALANDNGLTPHFNKAIHPQGFVLDLLEGSGWTVTLWFQNVPLSGKEEPTTCGYHNRPYPDPAQFLFYVEPRFFWVSQRDADSVQAAIVERLKALGYKVQTEPLLCGAIGVGRRQVVTPRLRRPMRNPSGVLWRRLSLE